MWSVDQQTELRINQDLVSRAHSGVWGHPLSLSLVFLTTTVLRDHPFVMSGFAFLFAIQTAMRMFLIRRTAGHGARSAPIWRFWLLSLLMVSGLLWGLLAAWSCFVYGFNHPNGCLLMLYHAAVAVVGTELFVHDLRLGRWYLVALYLPPMMIQGVSPDTQRWGPLCAFSFYALFLFARLKKLCVEYHEKLAENRDLEATANLDPLTGLLNRLAMKRNMDQELSSARESGRRVALLFIDLDGFKGINDTLSHRVGDLVLCEIATRLTRCGGSTHHVARLGGDEFTILLTQPALTASPSTVLSFAAEVLAAIRNPMVIESHQCLVGASIGIGVFPDDAISAEELVRSADRAMYEAKRTGKNRICSFRAGSARDQVIADDVGWLEDVLCNNPAIRGPLMADGPESRETVAVGRRKPGQRPKPPPPVA